MTVETPADERIQTRIVALRTEIEALVEREEAERLFKRGFVKDDKGELIQVGQGAQTHREIPSEPFTSTPPTYAAHRGALEVELHRLEQMAGLTKEDS